MLMIQNEGKIALIFGIRNERSLAFAIARKLQESGCRIAATYLPDTKEEVLSILEKYKMEVALAREVDVRHEEAIRHFVHSTYQKHGPIDYLLHGVAHASPRVMCFNVPGAQETPPSYLDIPFEELMDSFNISSYSLLRICRVAEPFLAEKASILTLTYNASHRVFPLYAGMAINKAALENIVLYLAHHFGSKGIRVNAISAGLVMTSSAGGIQGVRKLRKIGSHTAPLGNIQAEDVAGTALYYFSPLSAKVSGHIHFLDGGFNIMGIGIEE